MVIEEILILQKEMFYGSYFIHIIKLLEPIDSGMATQHLTTTLHRINFHWFYADIIFVYKMNAPGKYC